MDDNNCNNLIISCIYIYIGFKSSTVNLRIPIFMAASIKAFPFPVKCDNPTPTIR